MGLLFETFTPEPYTFLRLGKQVEGTVLLGEYPGMGVFKRRHGATVTGDTEALSSDATLRISPDEDFVSDLPELSGHGIRLDRDGKVDEYRIIGQPEGMDFDTGRLEFYRLELKKEDIWQGSL